MKIILLLAAVPAWAGFADLARKGFYQHHRGRKSVNRRRSSPDQQSMNQYAAKLKQQKLQQKYRQQDLLVADITNDEVIDQLLGSFGFN